MCGGSLINDRFILTAAHCLNSKPLPAKMVITLGSLTTEDRFSRTNLKVESVHVHPQYNKVGEVNDIALIKLKKPVIFNETIRPICLPSFTGQDNLFVVGWGLSSNGFDPATGEVQLQEVNVLSEVEVSEVDIHTCKAQYTNVDILKDICAGGRSGGTCLGDSGGPLSTRKEGHVYQVGVTSFGAVDCGAITNYPSVYERISAHLEWIKKVTKNSKWCGSKYQDAS